MCIWRVSHSLMIWKDNLQPNCWNKWLGSGFFWRSRKKHKFGQFSHSVGFYSLQPHGLQHARLPGPSPNPRAYSNSCPLIGDAIKPSHPLLSPSSPTISLPQHQGLFQWVSSFHQVAKVLEFQLQHQSFQWTPRTDFLEDGLVGSPCSPRDSHESSPTPQFKSINSSALSFFYSQTLTSIHDHWKNHRLN